MDRKSAALISAICIMLGISAAVAYDTWFAEEGHAAAGRVQQVQMEAQIQEEMELASIAVGTDARVINGGCRDMWIRASVRQAGDAEGAEGSSASEADWELISDSIAGHATEEDMQEGVWIPDSDGYYYYSKPVPPGEQSKPLFREVKGRGASSPADLSGAEDRVRVQAEGIQVNWIGETAESGKEAFERFCLRRPLEEYRGTFV